MATSNEMGGGLRLDQEEIARRAYEIYLQRGSLPGHETDDWLQAEAELASAQARAEEAAQPGQAKADRGTSEPAPRRTNGRREAGAGSGRRTLRP